jgi:hypothetical protein
LSHPPWSLRRQLPRRLTYVPASSCERARARVRASSVSAPAGWAAGDRLCGAGTAYSKKRTEQVGARHASQPLPPLQRLRPAALRDPPRFIREPSTPLSSGPALHWARPFPYTPPLIGFRSRSSCFSWLPLALPGSFLMVRPHPLIRHQTPPSAGRGSSSIQPSFILFGVLGVWNMRVNQTCPCSRGIQGLLRDTKLCSNSDNLGR